MSSKAAERVDRKTKERIERVLIGRLTEQVDVPTLDGVLTFEASAPATPVKTPGHHQHHHHHHMIATPTAVAKIATKLFGFEKNVAKLYGVPLSSVVQHSFPAVLESMMQYISAHIEEEGIFRRSGVSSRIKSLIKVVEECHADGDALELDNAEFLKKHGLEAINTHDITGAFKSFFQQLPEPLLTFRLFEPFEQISKQSETLTIPRRLKALQILILLLPESHQVVLKGLLRFIHHISQHSAANKMQASNLAKMFEPNLLRSADEDPLEPGGCINITNRVDAIERAELRARLIQVMIEQHMEIFETPSDLLEDIERATANEDSDCVAPVSFVCAPITSKEQREKTVEDATRAELRKLIEHIQSDPKLSKKQKKKMLKQYEAFHSAENKENSAMAL